MELADKRFAMCLSFQIDRPLPQTGLMVVFASGGGIVAVELQSGSLACLHNEIDLDPIGHPTRPREALRISSCLAHT